MEDKARRPRTLMLPPAPYVAALIGGWWLDRNLWPLHWDWGAATQSIGWLLMGVGLALFVWTRNTFTRHHTTLNPYMAASSLCTDGPFGFSRNPFYLVDWIILAAVSLLLNTVWPLAFAPLIWVVLRFGVIRHEEVHLEAKFGDVYRDYRARVRRWV